MSFKNTTYLEIRSTGAGPLRILGLYYSKIDLQFKNLNAV